MSKLTALKEHLQEGHIYRRADLLAWTNAVDRHLKQLVKDGTLSKLSGGLYYYPKQTSFGALPANELDLVEVFLNDDRFLLTSPNAYNALGLGSTQLYNETVVYNHKRHGLHKLGNRTFDFRLKPHFPKSLSEEFLLVDLVNNVDRLAEDKSTLLDSVVKKMENVDLKALNKAVLEYGGLQAKKFFKPLLNHATLTHA